MESRKEILKIKNLSYSFDLGERKKYQIINDISFNLKRGEFLSITGPSGCGKSTLLRIIAGLIKSKKGEITNNATKSAFVFQNYAIFPWFNVYENIEFGLKMNGVKNNERKKIVKNKIIEMDLVGHENDYPKELSGGMKQRVGIGRALAISPDLLFMDEPFSNLDYFTAEKLRKEIIDLCIKYKITVIMVTHAIDEAIEMSNRIIVMSKGPNAKINSIHEIEAKFPRDRKSEYFNKKIDEIRKEIVL
ncbi:MAG: ABC transporter ATP-binding protein [Candidatus Paceibacterota bacterium]